MVIDIRPRSAARTVVSAVSPPVAPADPFTPGLGGVLEFRYARDL